jgi:squalene cyclase
LGKEAEVPSTAEARAKEALTSGVAFLLARQGRDGLWRDFETLAGEASDWPTAFVGNQLLDAGVRGAPIDTAADALLARQHRDGGWGYHHDVPSDADSTAWVLTLLAAIGRDREAMERAGRCLRRHQDPRSGGVATFADPEPIRRYMTLGRRADLRGWCAPHLEVTATAGRAFAAVPGGRFRLEADLAWRYVERRQAADGGWGSYWWVDRHYPTLQAAALGSALGHRERAARAAEWALSEQLLGGAWGAPGVEQSAFATALSLAVILHCGGHGGAVRRALLELLRLQKTDGGWPSHASMRIPPPHVAEPDGYESWRVGGLGTGVVVRDYHRLFTTSACVSTLALAAGSFP